MPYRMKTVVDGRIYDVTLGRDKVGCVRLTERGWIAFTTTKGPMHRVHAESAEQGFRGLVAKLNRIELCGEDDEAKAREALYRRNEEIARRNDADWRALAPLREALEHVTGRTVARPRARSRRILI